MSTVYTPTAAPLTTVTLPADGDLRAAASVNLPLQTLANATALALNVRGARTAFTSSGTWVCPSNVTLVLLEAWGGGGGGGGGSGGGTSVSTGSMGGAGGSRAKRQVREVVVTPGTTYTVTIGTGGTAGTSGATGTGVGTVGTSGLDGNPTIFTDGASNVNTFYGGSGGVATQGNVTVTAYLPCGNSVAGVGYPTVINNRPIGGGWGVNGGTGISPAGTGEADAFLGGGGGTTGSNVGTAWGGGGGGGGQGGPGSNVPAGIPNGGNGGTGSSGSVGGFGTAGQSAAPNSGAGGGGGGGGGFAASGNGGTGGAGGTGGSGFLSVTVIG